MLNHLHPLVNVPNSWYAKLKRIGDFSFALTLFILTSPLFLLSMLFVKLTSRGPALYMQTRVGRLGKPFLIYKVRTMYHQCEKLTGPQWSQPGDSRITPLGRFLRKSHLDELPQLWNVIRGDMSLIGPRPERPEFVPNLEKAIPLYGQRLLVHPGVTGIAQVQLPPDTDLQSVKSKLAYDLHYVQGMGFFLDQRILWATLFKMMSVPYPMIRKLFAFPEQKRLEDDYQRLALQHVRAPEPAKPKTTPPVPVALAISTGGN